MKSALSRIRGRRRVVVGAATATLLALLLFANAPVSAQQVAPGSSTCPLLNLANPGPGDDVPNGDYTVSGTVLDPITHSTSGVSHVDFFLGQRPKIQCRLKATRRFVTVDHFKELLLVHGASAS